MKPHLIVITSNDEIVDWESKNRGRQSQLMSMIGSSGGRSALAASMINPIRRNLDYQAIGRAIFGVQAMPPGAVPTYNSSPIGEEGE